MLAYCRAFSSGFASSIPMSSIPEMGSFSSACSAARIATIIVLVFLGCVYRISIGRMLLMVAGAVMAIIPIVFLFLILQKYIMTGMSKAAMK